MNPNQKILTVLALCLLILSACYAPWKYSKSEGTDSSTRTEYSPVWLPPDSSSPYTVNEVCLLWSSLLMTWATIGIAYTGLFFVLKTSIPFPAGVKKSLVAVPVACVLAIVVIWLVRINHPASSISPPTRDPNDLSDLGVRDSTNSAYVK